MADLVRKACDARFRVTPKMCEGFAKLREAVINTAEEVKEGSEFIDDPSDGAPDNGSKLLARFGCGFQAGFCLMDRREKLREPFPHAADSLEELYVPPNYGLHALTGNRSGTWSMTVTKNWRLTFRLSERGALIDVNLEDYHGAKDTSFSYRACRRLASD